MEEINLADEAKQLMPDITMCQPTNCDKKTTCYRYTATPSERQAYQDFSRYIEADGGECSMYWNDYLVEE